MFKNNDLGWKELSLLILIAYSFGFAVRLIWIFQFQGNPSFIWNNELMINTNDGYFFASAVDYLLTGVNSENPRVPIALESYPGMVYVSYYLTKFTPMSLETTILYAPAIIASLIVVPIILIGRLVNLSWVGFFSALLGSIVWSYYNRTMIGYYDSDMFSVLLQFIILYFLLLTIHQKENKNIIWLSLIIVIYPFFYPQGISLIYAMFLLWTLYQLAFQRDEKNSYIFIILASIALWSVAIWVKVAVIIALFSLFSIMNFQNKLSRLHLFFLTLLSLLLFFYFANVFGLIIDKINIYTSRGVQSSGLHFYQVIQTVREAGKISWETVANRMIGHPILLGFSLVGYFLLVIKEKSFILALPLIGVGVFAHWAGLRFTVYAVPIASFSLIYLFYIISKNIKNRIIFASIFTLLSLIAIVPNITHIMGYKVPTVLKKAEVEDLVKLKQISNPKDYTLTWWDYGYPIWYYSNTSTLIDGAKHHNDNFIISTIMQSDSEELVANLSRLAVETYVNSNYKTIADTMFKNGKKNQLNPNDFLEELKSKNYKLPQKTRDVYLYMPYRMMNIFPTVSVFGNLDLTTGKKKRNMIFYPSHIKSNNGGILTLGNGIIVNAQQGRISIGRNKVNIKNFVVTQNRGDKIAVQSQLYHYDGGYSVVFMKSYNRFIVMDNETFNSAYVQMFILGKYDKNLFELVVSSPYSKIYKLKK